MFELEIQSLRRWRLRLGRLHLRTWKSHVMRLPRGYRQPEIVYAVVRDDEEAGVASTQLGAFDSEAEAQRLIDLLEEDDSGGRLLIDVIPIHSRLEDWSWDR